MLISLLNDLVGEELIPKEIIQIILLLLIFFEYGVKLDKQFILNGGYSNSSSKRDHPIDLNVQNVNLKCNIIDLGVELEILKNLSILSSHKRLFSNGLDYFPIRSNDFTIESYNAFQCDLVHEINSLGYL